ncbi:MAG: rhodanese-like domain-containing protein [Treponema sp.]|jgi:rhodanese-related sulfurtransferase|nr:rhodanese-like domain-containing protein [Treponema sp.]
MDSSLLVDICGPSRDGQRLARDAAGNLFLARNGPWEQFDFNGTYAGYYPACSFTAAAYAGGVFYLAGLDGSGCPQLFSSLMGGVWEIRDLTMRHPILGHQRPSGEVLRILYAETVEQLFLVCRHGQLVTLPDCPHCVRILQVGEGEVVDGAIEGSLIIIHFADGTRQTVPIAYAAQYRVSMSFVKEKLDRGEATLVDLRSPAEYEQYRLPHSINITMDRLHEWLAAREKHETLVFLCRLGIQADRAVEFAREQGFSRSYSLGGIHKAAHVE